jgi:hypothetical protein
LGYVIWRQQTDFQTQRLVVSIFATLLTVLVTFGVLHSTGVVQGEKHQIFVELGGSAAMAVVVLAICLYYYRSQPPSSFAITIYLVSPEDQRETIKKAGKMTLTTNPPRHSEFHEGIAEFRELPSDATDQDVNYSVEVEGYQLSPDAPKTLRLRPAGTLFLKLQARSSKPEPFEPGPPIDAASPGIYMEKPGKDFFEEKEIVAFANKRLIRYKNESVQDTLVVFKTKGQQTWLFATKHQVFTILDTTIDETGSGRRCSLLRALQLDKDMKAEVADGSEEGSVVFSLNNGAAWTLYSPNELGEPNRARQRIQLFIDSALDRQKMK